MKKYIYLLFVWAMTAFISCTDSTEVEIIRKSEVNITVNTSNMYNPILSTIKTTLGDNTNISVGVTTLIYDAKGNFCKETTSSTRTLQPINQVFKDLSYGEYTIIAIETLINNAQNQSPFWTIENKNNLKDLRVVSVKDLDNCIPEIGCIGFASQTIQLTSNNLNANISPLLDGCFVEFGGENFDQSNYNFLAFNFKDVANGYYLDPQKIGVDKYYYSKEDYNPTKIWSWRAFIYNEHFSNKESNNLYVLESGKTQYCFASSTVDKDGHVADFTAYPSANEDFDFKSGEKYKAYCYYKGDGYPEMETYLGTSSGFEKWYSALDKSMYPIYAEPCTVWGCSVSHVKDYMKDYKLYTDISQGSFSYYMTYYGKYKENYIEYSFDTDKTGLNRVLIDVLADKVSEEDILTMLSSTYEYSDYSEELGCHFLYNSNSIVCVYPKIEENGIWVTRTIYLPVSIFENTPKTRSVRNDTISESSMVSLLKRVGCARNE